MKTQTDLLQHFLATLTYRTQKALRDAPDSFAAFRAGSGVRSPGETIQHMNEVLHLTLNELTDRDTPVEASSSYEDEARFHDLLDQMSQALEQHPDLDPAGAKRLLQGPFVDAMTHVGQLALLRRLAGSPVAPENFYVAAISSANVSAHQPSPEQPFHEWADADGRSHRPESTA